MRERHCSIEGGSFSCQYGENKVCSSLPLDGVSDHDYEVHVQKYHVSQLSNEQHQKWSVFSAAQNLSAVLNDPNRGKQTNFLTKKWGDSFTEKSAIPTTPHLTDIKWSQFDPYLKKIGKRYKRHERFSKTAIHLNSNESTSSTSSPHHKNIYDELNLNEIPPIFMKPNLELHNPATFALVFPNLSDNVHEQSHQQSGRILQEKLSHYLDIVEVQIAKQVSQKSSAFFHAMTSQDTIMEQMNEAAKNVKSLRNGIQLVGTKLVNESLTIISSARLKTNKTNVLEKLKLMQTVHQTQPMIQLLLGTQDYVAALDLITTTQEILQKELTGIHCFRHLSSQLTEMENLIDKMLTTDFERYATADLNRPLVDIAQDKIQDEDKLICIISGMLRQKNFNFVSSYKEESITTIRAIIKQMVIEVIASSDAEVCLTGAGEEAQILSLSEWIVLLETATVTLCKLLNRIKNVYDVMLHTANLSSGQITDNISFIDTEIFLSSDDYKIVETKLNDLLQSVCNYCHERCANLVSNQSLEKSTATADEIEKLSEIVEQFTEGCEKISGVQSVPLRAALKGQATRFAQKFHADHKSKLALLLDSERWKQNDVPAEFQKIVENISKGDFLWTKTDDLVQLNTAPSPVLMVKNEPYAMCGAGLLLIKIVTEYCRCANKLPVIAAQLARNVIDLLRTFNSRCCQLVLGAGALRVAGLKTITSGNLVLVSRVLQLVLWLLPHLRTHFQSFDINGNATILTGYESVERDFISHIKEIEGKVLSIVVTLIQNQLGNWEARPPVPSQSFRNISRHFVKLHEAIAPILPEQQVNDIYRIVNKNFKDKLREQLLKYNIINNGGPQHGVVISELTFYLETLRTLKAMPEDELLNETMNDIWLK